MPEKVINSRIRNKHDTESNWNSASSFVPEDGEVIIYDVDSSHSAPRVKIGDGTTTIANLPFAGRVREEHTVATSAWTALSGQAPYTYSTNITIDAVLSDDATLELLNNNQTLFRQYLFGIGAASGQTATIYALTRPTSSITFRFEISY